MTGGNGQLLEEVADGGGLLLSRVASKGAAQLLDLADGGLVPSGPKALNRQWQENNTLVMAGLPRFVQFPLVGDSEGVSRGLSSLDMV